MTSTEHITELAEQIRERAGDYLGALEELERIALESVPSTFTYDELSDAAKEKVREVNAWYAWGDGSAGETCYEAAEQMFAEIGLEMTDLTYALHDRSGEPRFSVNGTIGTDFHVEAKMTRWGVDIDWYVGDDEYADGAQPEEGAKFIRKLMPAMQAAISKMLYAEDEYVSSAEYAKEISDANDYRYDEDGHIV